MNLFQPDGNGDCTIDLGMQVVTGADGLYLFENLEPGDYCVQFDITALPDDFCDTDGFALGAPQFTALNVGGDPAIDSDADPATGTTDGLTLGAGETNRTLDAGIVCPAKIGDRVWEDTNQDGLQDGGRARCLRVLPSDSLTADPMVSPVRPTMSIRASRGSPT